VRIFCEEFTAAIAQKAKTAKTAMKIPGFLCPRGCW